MHDGLEYSDGNYIVSAGGWVFPKKFPSSQKFRKTLFAQADVLGVEELIAQIMHLEFLVEIKRAMVKMTI